MPLIRSLGRSGWTQLLRSCSPYIAPNTRRAGLALLTLGAIVTGTAACAADDLSAPPPAMISRAPRDEDPAVTTDIRTRLAACLATPGDRSECVGLSADHCPANLQPSVCAASEAAVWSDYIRYYLSLIRERDHGGLAPSLDRAQSAWRAFADAQCHYVADLWLDTEPAMRSMSIAACGRDEAGRRALSLRADLLDLGPVQ